jgi:hypothetical protein
MPRDLPSAIKTELAKNAIAFADLVELHFDSVQKLTNAQINLVATTPTAGSSQTFSSNGNLLSFDLVQETGEAKVNQINISLSGTSSTFTNLFLNNSYVDRRVVIYRVFLDDQLGIIDNPVMMFDGEIQSFTINETGETSTVIVTSASVFYEFEKNNGRRTNETSQKAFFPADKGMKFSALTIDNILWGKPAP